MLPCAFLTLIAISAAETSSQHPLTDIHLRDPFILPVPSEGTYYLFGTGWRLDDGPGFMVYQSPDLLTWEGPSVAFQYSDEFWSDRDYWAPEVHAYRGKYYLFGSFKAEGACRGTQILVSDKPGGPFEPLTDGPVTPRDWECLDGTLFVDADDQPWMVFCHEWVQVGDGEMCAMQLSPDLTEATSEAILLFRASEPAWSNPIGQERKGYVTDGPFLLSTQDGSLLMLWSSFGEGGYKQAFARSQSGTIEGPWEHNLPLLHEENGGHGMLFHTFGGDLKLILHQPNGGAPPVPTIIDVVEDGGTLQCVNNSAQ